MGTMRRLKSIARKMKSLTSGKEVVSVEVIKEILPAPRQIAPVEIHFLALNILRVRPPIVVEIGSFCGASTTVIAWCLRKLRGGIVIVIDPFENYVTHTPAPANYEQVFDRNLLPYSNNVVKLKGLSTEVDWSLPIHVLFIDGDHSFEGVFRDINKFVPYVSESGLVFFHDYKAHGKPGVKKNVDKYFIGNPEFKLLGLVGSMIGFQRGQ